MGRALGSAGSSRGLCRWYTCPALAGGGVREQPINGLLRDDRKTFFETEEGNCVEGGSDDANCHQPPKGLQPIRLICETEAEQLPRPVDRLETVGDASSFDKIFLITNIFQ